MSRQNRQRAIDLLCQHGASKLMRQRDRPQRQHQSCARARRVGPTVSWPDGKYQRLRSVVAQPPNLLGDPLRRELLSPAVQQDKYRCRPCGLPIHPSQQSGLGVIRLRLARRIARRTDQIIRRKRSGSVRL